ncbi:hypothetical protein DAPPUDRAFT_58422 [Daphnia pulex]|uniref:Uncharacterized protein n=1 Tax=Daphnia pulex TaxID=6669 RepID=E9H5Q6_DAPPU|nr:hypothetical protein DAPPUDRAFT_58422 [Daphnia pulex]|eukprot:EFX73046.1 hypothetical protein DAPPUDRAFT_58422 [Daphnia pulex]
MSSTEIGTFRQNSLSSHQFCHQSHNNVIDAPIHPSSQKSVPSSNSASQRALRSEALRLATFQGWPLEYLSPRDLSRAGFFYRGLADQTQCAFCCITISQWEAHDDPMAEHRRHAPNCPFVLQLSVGNIPLSTRHPELTSLEARLKTFDDWPPGLEQRPPQLAEAGFYYMKTGDHVKCFCCDGALRNWEPKDDPWVEHARWFSRCNFLVSVKGNDYIREIQARYKV